MAYSLILQWWLVLALTGSGIRCQTATLCPAGQIVKNGETTCSTYSPCEVTGDRPAQNGVVLQATGSNSRQYTFSLPYLTKSSCAVRLSGFEIYHSSTTAATCEVAISIWIKDTVKANQYVLQFLSSKATLPSQATTTPTFYRHYFSTTQSYLLPYSPPRTLIFGITAYNQACRLLGTAAQTTKYQDGGRIPPAIAGTLNMNKKANAKLSIRLIFEDDDECSKTPPPCQTFANNVCFNTFGSYSCVCKAGYTGTGGQSGSCTNINECATAQDNNCTSYSNTYCSDTQGAFLCPCQQGFNASSTSLLSNCVNIDECTLKTDNCSLYSNTHCQDTIGGFQCLCNQGFGTSAPQPSSCSNTDECALGSHNCNLYNNTVCVDTVGAFLCVCSNGFSAMTSPAPGMTSSHCSNIDECSASPGLCQASDTCVDTIGSYSCVAPATFATTTVAATMATTLPTIGVATTTIQTSPSPASTTASRPTTVSMTAATTELTVQTSDIVTMPTTAMQTPTTGQSSTAALTSSPASDTVATTSSVPTTPPPTTSQSTTAAPTGTTLSSGSPTIGVSSTSNVVTTTMSATTPPLPATTQPLQTTPTAATPPATTSAQSTTAQSTTAQSTTAQLPTTTQSTTVQPATTSSPVQRTTSPFSTRLSTSIISTSAGATATPAATQTSGVVIAAQQASSTSIGPIVGGSVAAVVILLAIFIVVILVKKRQRGSKEELIGPTGSAADDLNTAYAMSLRNMALPDIPFQVARANTYVADINESEPPSPVGSGADHRKLLDNSNTEKGGHEFAKPRSISTSTAASGMPEHGEYQQMSPDTSDQSLTPARRSGMLKEARQRESQHFSATMPQSQTTSFGGDGDVTSKGRKLSTGSNQYVNASTSSTTATRVGAVPEDSHYDELASATSPYETAWSATGGTGRPLPSVMQQPSPYLTAWPETDDVGKALPSGAPRSPSPYEEAWSPTDEVGRALPSAPSPYEEAWSATGDAGRPLPPVTPQSQTSPFDNDDLYESLDTRVFDSQPYQDPPDTVEDLYSHLSTPVYRQLRRSDVHIGTEIGAGEFGVVMGGELDVKGKMTPVAIKTVKDGDPNATRTLLQEAALMGQFSHCNVTRLLGVVTQGPLLVVLELMARGDLRSHLHCLQPKQGTALPKSVPAQLLRMSREIAMGMAYLATRQFIHRDLAARNVLLDESFVCKIGDFGMSRNLADDAYYQSHGGKIPVKWTSPEALLYRKYSSCSDVWSFGIVLFEMFSLGKKPYFGMSPSKVIAFVSVDMKRLAPPPGISRDLYKIMLECWHPDHHKRPTFQQLARKLSDAPTLLMQPTRSYGLQAQAYAIGGPLHASENLYEDLQATYLRHTMR